MASEFMEVGESAAREAGKMLLEMQKRVRVREKSPRDLVTEADVAAQEAIREAVLSAFPSHGFLGEEELPARNVSATSATAMSEYRWVVDPLDGTANYVHGLQSFAVSIALQKGSDVILGIVFDPCSGEFYSAEAGRGAFLNGQRLTTSGCCQLDQAMIAASFSSNVQRGSREISRFIDVLLASQSVRRLGSAALNLCYVAAGRLDAYWTTCVKTWDVAAGVLIVREANGIVTNVEGGLFDLARPEFIASASVELQTQLVTVLNQ